MKAHDFWKFILFCGLALFVLSACEVEEPGGGEGGTQGGFIKFVEIAGDTFHHGESGR